MIRRPSGVTATQFSLGFIDCGSGLPCAPGIVPRSRPSSMRQTKIVASAEVPATSRVPSGVNARHPMPCLSASCGRAACAAQARPARARSRREVSHDLCGLRDPPQADDITARAGHQAAVGRECDVLDLALMQFLAEQQPVARQVPQCDLTIILSPEQFRAVRRERDRLDTTRLIRPARRFA